MNPHRTPLSVLVALSLVLTACTGQESGAAPAVAGAASAGDPMAPGDGNGGYDVQHYDLDLRITPHGRPVLTGSATSRPARPGRCHASPSTGPV
jgi:hypothetical protein